MPLRLVPPRQGKTPNFYIRGTHLGQYVDISARTDRRALAKQVLERTERQIERDEFSHKVAPSFAMMAEGYISAGGEERFIRPLIRHFKDTPARMIGQTEIDTAAVALYPLASAATRNRQVYTPVCAVLRHGGINLDLRRPKGAQGQRVTSWLWPEEAERLFNAAAKKDAEFAVLLLLLCYTGMRLSEALAMTIRDMRLGESFAYVPTTKNGDPRPVFLPPVVVAALANHPRGLERDGRVFRFRRSGHLYALLAACAARAEITLPERSAFHLLRHTWGTWMRRYVGLDSKGLVATGTWKDEKSASRYAHVVVSEEAMKAALLPEPKLRKA